MSKIAVIGGAGFVGANLVRSLVERGDDVLVIDDFSTGLFSNLARLECEVRKFSILEADELTKVLNKCEVIYHLAARGSVPRSIKDPKNTFEVNTLGTLNVLNAARTNGSKLFFSSSSSVYGLNSELPKREKSWIAPLTPYAASKLSGEALIGSYSHTYGIPVLMFRFFNIFGPLQRPDHDYAAVIPKWLWKSINGEEIQVFGSGRQTRDFTYIDTVVEVLIEALKKEVAHPTPINLAFGNKISLNEIIEEIRFLAPDLTVTYSDERRGDIHDSQNDATLLKSFFPSVIPVNFRDGLIRTWQWLNEKKNSSKITGFNF